MRTRRWLEGWLVLALLALLGTGAAARDSGKVFVSSEKDNAMTVLDAARMEVLGAQALCRRPRHMQLTPDRAREEPAAHPDPAVDAPAVDGHVAFLERLLPREHVRVDGVHEGPVEVEDQRRHRA